MTDIHIRAGEFELRDDGRTVTGRLVPYGEVADIVELNDAGEIERYREQFLPHSLAAMAQGFKARGGNASRQSNCFVPFLLDHHERFDAMIGHAVTLEDREDGAWSDFRLYDDANIVKVRSILTESHNGLSIAFHDVRAPKVIDGIVSRVQVHVGHVAATPVPAYMGAGIESMRNGELMPPSGTPMLDAVKAWLQSQREMVSK